MNIGFIGVGKLGMPCAEEMSKKGHNVKGYDVANVESIIIDIKDSIQETVEGSDIIFVAVPTPHDPAYDGRKPTLHLEPKDFNYDIVKQVLIEANSYTNKKQMLVLISTVLPGTTREQFIPLVTNARFVYNPYLIAMGSVAWDFLHPDIIMIGTEDGTETGDAKELIDFYQGVVENQPDIKVGTWDECECIKVFYNTFISAKIGLVNMIQDVAQKQGNINVDVVTDALSSSTKRIISKQYMTAGMGDGGACHPRDNIALRYMAEKLDLGYDLFHAVMSAREIQAKNVAQFMIDHCNGLPLYIHGEAYKPNVPYLDGSYSILIYNYLKELGHTSTFIDPVTRPDSIPKSIKGCVLLAHNASVTYDYINKELPSNQSTYCNFDEGSIIIDPWRKYNVPRDDITIIHYGNTRA